jgi:TRAP-type C4-dicarboxylate transport system permease small subunit
MKQFEGLVTGLSRVLDKIAGFCMVAVMLLVVSNVILRAVFSRPILGTYEYVVFLTAVMIALALAYCAVQNGHIAVGFVVDRLSCRIQAAVDIFVNITALFFWGLCAWQVANYAKTMQISGVVSPTTQTPFYPFIYLVALGLLSLCLVSAVRAAASIQKAAARQ